MVDTAKLWTVREVLEWTSGYLKRQRIEQPRLEAELLLGKSLGQTRVQLYMNLDQPLSAGELAAYRSLIRRRAERVPTAYLLGEKEFMSLALEVNRQVLIPRPETELLVEEAIRCLNQLADLGENSPLIADVGTGSGNIAIALARHFPLARVVALDISPAALEVAKRNAARHQVERQMEFIEGDLLTPVLKKLDCKFNLITANLPYIGSNELPHLPPEVLFEPLIALDGGKDGLAHYRRLVPQARECLAAEGWLLLEIGSGQARAVSKLFAADFWGLPRIIPDYTGRDRVLEVQKKSPHPPARGSLYLKRPAPCAEKDQK
ncbi:MAG: peptide chain release factor N(5)-glutamine methyltransferase [Syntrophomonadaceae bacterium]|nr:peptide chain release factor N(5)-glutamine methyltransferase [Syntrophomonadaceae bacterium]